MEQLLDKRKFGPWAIVTGASSGIGREFARQIAFNGIHVVLVARRGRLLEEARGRFEKEYGVQCRVVQSDLSKDGFLDGIESATRDLDIGLVVSNAGTASPGEFLKHDRSSIIDLFKLNAQAHLELSHYFGRRLAERKRGGLLLVGAMGAAQGVPYLAHESASKSFVLTLGESLNFELSPLGIHVTVLVVGPTKTAIVEKFGLEPKTMPMKPMPPDKCAFEGLGAINRNRPSLINGRLNRAMNALIPSKLSRRMMKRMMEQGLRAKGVL